MVDEDTPKWEALWIEKEKKEFNELLFEVMRKNFDDLSLGLLTEALEIALEVAEPRE